MATLTTDRLPYPPAAWIWVRTRRGLRAAHVVTDDGLRVTFRFAGGGITFTRLWVHTFARTQRVAND